ncbi:MAG: hypothetical protein J2P19_00590 [Pseudonocardia sp.]|nr:hypothetical protein [Pseudonocardia sp.]
MTLLPQSLVGVERIVSYQVREQEMVRRLLPDVAEFARKPEIMATAWLVGVCEWPAMDVLREYMTDSECSLGTGIAIRHRAPVPPGARLRVSTRCMQVKGAFSEWAVDAHDDVEQVADGTVGFVIVECEYFVRQRIAPKAAALTSNGRPRCEQFWEQQPSTRH